MSDQRRDRGFTLTETLVVITIIGLVAVVIAGTFIVIVRTSPSTEARTDDSRSLLGLTTWLPPDVSSTAETGFTEGNFPSGCGAGIPGVGLLELEWTQNSNVYRANYRYVQQGTSHHIKRYACVNGGSTTELNLTSDLPPIGGAPPVTIQLFPGGAGTSGVQFDVSVVDENGIQREFLSLDAFTENVPSTMPPLPPDPTAPPPTTQPNQGPTAYDYTYQVHHSASTPLFVLGTDPDNDNLIASIVGGPAWVTQTGPMEITANPPLGALTSPTTFYPVTVEVADTSMEVDTATITLEVVDTSVATTTTSTTTTTAAPNPTCVASIQNVTPAVTSNKTNQGNPTDVGKLVDEVRVAITSNGFCGPLVLEFDPDPLVGGPNEILALNNAQSATFPQNLLWRDSGGTPHLIRLKDGVAGPVLHTALLTVH